MKKLILLLLVVLGGVMQGSATTIYIKNNCNWSNIYLYLYGNGESQTWPGTQLNASNTVTVDNTEFYIVDTGNAESFIFHNNNTNPNERAEYQVSAVTEGSYYYLEYSNENEGKKYYNLVSLGTVHNVYVTIMQSAANPPRIHTWEGTFNSNWPGHTLEVVSGGTNQYVFKTLQTSFKGLFNTDGDNDKSGDITFDLSGGDVYYNYYPNNHQAVPTSIALETPATLYFQSNISANDLKMYHWNHEGWYWVSPQAFASVPTEEIAGATWYKIETYSPSFSGQFYSYDNGEDHNKNCTYDFALTSGEKAFFYAKVDEKDKPILKLSSKYYLIYKTFASNGDWPDITDSGNSFVEMTSVDDFTFSGILDNLDGNVIRYLIVPEEAVTISGTEATIDWSYTISPNSSEYYSIKWQVMNSDVMPRSWKRWQINPNDVKAKYEISFNFATMTLTSTPYFERTLNAAGQGYSTFSSDYNVTIPSELTASYASAVNVKNSKITWTPFEGTIPANQGALLEGNAGETYKFTPAEATEFTATNFLKPHLTNDAALAQTSDGNTNYILSIKDSEVGFYKVHADGSWVAAGAAYLAVPKATTQNEAPAFFAIGGGEGTTGIRAINNGQLIMDNVYYDLSGRRVANPTKGLYIVNGKKVIVK